MSMERETPRESSGRLLGSTGKNKTSETGLFHFIFTVA